MRKFWKKAALAAALAVAATQANAGCTSGYIEAVGNGTVQVNGKTYTISGAKHRRDSHDIVNDVEHMHHHELQVGDRVTLHYEGSHYDGVHVYAFRPHDHKAVKQSGERAARFAYERRYAERLAAREAERQRQELMFAVAKAQAAEAQARAQREQEAHELMMRMGNARAGVMERAAVGFNGANARVNFDF